MEIKYNDKTLRIEEDGQTAFWFKSEDLLKVEVKVTAEEEEAILRKVYAYTRDGFIRELSDIVTEMVEIINGVVEEEHRIQQPHLLISQPEVNKILITDGLSGAFLSLKFVEGEDRLEGFKVLNGIFILPDQAPFELKNIMPYNAYAIWRKMKSRYEEYVRAVLTPTPPVTEEEEQPKALPVTDLKFRDSLFEDLDYLAGYVLSSEALESLKSYLADTFSDQLEKLTIRRFEIFTNTIKDDVVTIMVHDPSDVAGTNLEFVYGDSMKPHGKTGWSVTENFYTGTGVDRTVSYF